MALLSHEGDAVTLRDGREVLIGPLTPADAPLLAEAFEQLSEESRRLRFLGPKTSLTGAELLSLPAAPDRGRSGYRRPMVLIPFN